jgi:hypothetical protein
MLSHRTCHLPRIRSRPLSNLTIRSKAISMGVNRRRIRTHATRTVTFIHNDAEFVVVRQSRRLTMQWTPPMCWGSNRPSSATVLAEQANVLPAAATTDNHTRLGRRRTVDYSHCDAVKSCHVYTSAVFEIGRSSFQSQMLLLLQLGC